MTTTIEPPIEPHILQPEQVAPDESLSAKPSRRDHMAALRAAVRSVATRSPGEEVERWLLRAGAVLVPLGFFAIVAGYWGAAHAGRVIQQIPYQISGGLLGVALVFAGAFAYFSYWLTRILREQQRTITALDQQTTTIVGELRALRQAIEADGGGASRAAPANETEPLVATPKGSLVHRAGCPVVAGRLDLRPADLSRPEARPCKVCVPTLGEAA